MGNLNIISNTLKGGVPVTVEDCSKTNDSGLHWACSFGNLEVAKLLLSHGFDVNTVNADGQTGLHQAVKIGNFELVEVLLFEGANPGIVDSTGRTAKDMNVKKVESIDNILDNPPTPTLLCRAIFLASQSPLIPSASSSTVLSEEDKAPVIASVTHDRNDNLRTPTKSRPSPNLQQSRITEVEENDDGDFFEDDTSKDPLLVLWPPAQRQIRSKSGPFTLSSAVNVVISVASSDIDIFPLLTWSGLLDTLDKFGLQAQVKRSSPGAKIRLCIDCMLCPGRHRYELKVGPDQTLVTASDATGLLYAIYSFIQLLQLHSEISTEAGVTKVLVSPVVIHDWPDVANRAVLWSYRRDARVSPACLRDQIELLSRLRINMLMLMVDSASADDDDDEYAALRIDPSPLPSVASSPSRVLGSSVYSDVSSSATGHCY